MALFFFWLLISPILFFWNVHAAYWYTWEIISKGTSRSFPFSPWWSLPVSLGSQNSIVFPHCTRQNQPLQRTPCPLPRSSTGERRFGHCQNTDQLPQTRSIIIEFFFLSMLLRYGQWTLEVFYFYFITAKMQVCACVLCMFRMLSTLLDDKECSKAGVHGLAQMRSTRLHL